MCSSELIELGVISKPHGLRGELCVHYYAESVDLLRGEVWMQTSSQAPRIIKIEQVRKHSGQVVVKFEGVNDRTTAEHMRGIILLTPENSLPEPDEDEIYLYSILDLPIYDTKSNAYIGKLSQVDFIHSQELWVIIDDADNEILFPAVPEFVDLIDLDNEKIFITPPEGLLELYINKD